MSYTKEQQQQIKMFIENEPMAAIVKAVMLQEIAPEGFQRFIGTLNPALPDAEYGQQVKARAEAAAILERGFAQLKQIASGNQGVQSKQNPAR